jgi:hypothetical protein
MSGIRGADFLPATGYMALDTIRAGWPVSAQTIRAAAATANWLLARGVPLIIDGGHMWSGTGSPITRTLNYRYQVDANHDSLALEVVVSASQLTLIGIAGSGYLVTTSPAVIHIPYPNLLGDGEVYFGLQFAWSSTAILNVHQVSLYEAPTITIDDSGTTAPEAHTSVDDGWDERESIAGLARAVEELRATYYRRGTLFNWALGTANGFSTGSTTYVDFFQELKPAIQNRLMYSGETTRSVKVAVFGRVTSGGEGRVLITLNDGTTTRTVQFRVLSTTDDWVTTDTIAVNTDQPSRWDADGGLRGGNRDEIQISARVTGAGATVYVLAVSIWDAPG